MADSQVKSGNLLPTYQGLEVYGVKFTILSDGKVCANGTPTQDYAFSNTIPANISGDYYFSGCPSGGSYSSYDVFIYDKTAAARPKMWDGTTASLSDFGGSANNQVKIVAGHETEFRIRVRQGYELRNVIFSPYLREPTSPPYYMPYSSTGWQHSLRKLGTATETLTLPQTIYADGTAITAYTIKGNTVQNGTPTPSNPVEVNGVGVRTENLFDGSTSATNQRLSTSGTGTYAAQGYSVSRFIEIEPSTYYRITTGETSYYNLYNENKQYIYGSATNARISDSYANARYIRFDFKTENIPSVMLVKGSTAPSAYEPYGYKIPISSGGVTTNIYLGSTQTVRQIKKLVFDGTENNWRITGTGRMGIPLSDLPQRLTNPYCSHFIGTNVETYSNVGNGECSISVVNGSVREFGCYDSSITTLADFKTWLQQQYANGTPVTVWYVLATPKTSAVNEPLQKIGDYADTLSNAASIPTTDGANSITVDTTVQPSEFTATWTGWHDSSVKEWDGSQWS